MIAVNVHIKNYDYLSANTNTNLLYRSVIKKRHIKYAHKINTSNNSSFQDW